ncbi:MAG: TFIIB-type zinc ribbon-containing protein [Nanoarchaeota archaeon]|nr:TFIIB-type zinc ribbon-containing protein [Nanoarchaeota archaeon]
MGSEKSLQSIEGQGTKTCPECGSPDLDRKDGELYCKKCGLVID